MLLLLSLSLLSHADTQKQTNKNKKKTKKTHHAREPVKAPVHLVRVHEQHDGLGLGVQTPTLLGGGGREEVGRELEAGRVGPVLVPPRAARPLFNGLPVQKRAAAVVRDLVLREPAAQRAEDERADAHRRFGVWVFGFGFLGVCGARVARRRRRRAAGGRTARALVRFAPCPAVLLRGCESCSLVGLPECAPCKERPGSRRHAREEEEGSMAGSLACACACVCALSPLACVGLVCWYFARDELRCRSLCVRGRRPLLKTLCFGPGLKGTRTRGGGDGDGQSALSLNSAVCFTAV